ncbi:hypothetical protein CR194_09580 [Salipaludibacillus keqinensis]|uniref:Helix-turn-helix domain-containing protein n=1 Tax=Salipaludibacillus keqinensis TaxID=2045207 RepID=A0A323TIM2_9BACI|nr:hypothetical protein [Salipaludibacillus keqinensis]PYZ93417.1 hypothetical protein CR194_09580 [Salipaludibacillus keqinensis]
MMTNGQIQQFKQFSTFPSLGEFNQAVKKWMHTYGESFTKGEKVALIRLTRYCVKVVGVANVKIGTILKVIHEEFGGHGISRSTFKRMIAKAKGIGMIKVIELKRNSGGQSSNLYVFQPYPTDPSEVSKKISAQASPQTTSKQVKSSNVSSSQSIELPNREQMNHHKAKENIKTNPQEKEITKRKKSADHTYTSDAVPSSFKHLAKSFFDCSETIEELWKMVRISAYQHSFEKDPQIMLQVATESFKQTVRAMKKKTIRKPIAYFYGVITKKFDEYYVSQIAEMTVSEKADHLSPSIQNVHWLYA